MMYAPLFYASGKTFVIADSRFLYDSWLLAAAHAQTILIENKFSQARWVLGVMDMDKATGLQSYLYNNVPVMVVAEIDHE